MPDLSSVSIATSLKLTKALGQARRGRYDEAEALLMAEDLRRNPVALHALAALVTRRGDFLRALKLWQQLRQLEPAGGEASRMIAAIELWIARPAWYRFVPAGAAAVLIVALGLVLYSALGSVPPPPAAAGPRPAAVEVRPAPAAPIAPLRLDIPTGNGRKKRAGT